MKIKILSLGLLAGLMGLTSCSDNWSGDEPSNGTQAKLSLASLKVEVNPNATEVGRADVPNVNAFNVAIVSESGAEKGSWAYGSMPDFVVLEPGTYSVKVVSDLNPASAQFDAPHYAGTKDFSIAAGEVKNIGNITCNLANLKVSIRFTNELLDKLDAGSAKVSVRVNDGDELIFAADETRSGYFMLRDGSSSMVAEFTGKVGGSDVRLHQVFTENVLPGYHRIITFGYSTPVYPDPDPEGSASPSFIIDTTVTTVDVNSGITVEEQVIDNPGDRPGSGSDEPIDPPTPPTPGTDAITITSEYMSLTAINDAAEFGPAPLKPAALQLHADSKFAHIYVKIISNSLSPQELESVGLASQFDLAVPGDLEEGLSGLGFPVGTEVTTQTDVTFDITQFMALLAVLGPDIHTFEITAVDQSTPANEKTATLKIQVK